MDGSHRSGCRTGFVLIELLQDGKPLTQTSPPSLAASVAAALAALGPRLARGPSQLPRQHSKDRSDTASTVE